MLPNTLKTFSQIKLTHRSLKPKRLARLFRLRHKLNTIKWWDMNFSPLLSSLTSFKMESSMKPTEKNHQLATRFVTLGWDSRRVSQTGIHQRKQLAPSHPLQRPSQRSHLSDHWKSTKMTSLAETETASSAAIRRSFTLHRWREPIDRRLHTRAPGNQPMSVSLCWIISDEIIAWPFLKASCVYFVDGFSFSALDNLHFKITLSNPQENSSLSFTNTF
ncbi:hypothetical protein O181_000714 [Austropuccinia psidii MF-1]|uniref:Uncharacterized protein n=1 Tax=Austropuccinia psidii MF-1 TaxID=1389203 RepID=A0A9Q3B919_9BASI|nr:hypothetical protein [Austropuccinia psidii MF-1]